MSSTRVCASCGLTGPATTRYSGTHVVAPAPRSRPARTPPPSTSTRRSRSLGSAALTVGTDVNLAASSASKAAGRPTPTTRRSSDHPLCASSTAIAEATSRAAVGSPVTQIGPRAASRSTRTSRPSASRPRLTSPGTARPRTRRGGRRRRRDRPDPALLTDLPRPGPHRARRAEAQRDLVVATRSATTSGRSCPAGPAARRAAAAPGPAASPGRGPHPPAGDLDLDRASDGSASGAGDAPAPGRQQTGGQQTGADQVRRRRTGHRSRSGRRLPDPRVPTACRSVAPRCGAPRGTACAPPATHPPCRRQRTPGRRVASAPSAARPRPAAARPARPLRVLGHDEQPLRLDQAGRRRARSRPAASDRC